MLCYKDKTFCSYYLECKDGNKCSSALTPKVESDSKRWSEENNLPELLAVFTDKPECFELKE